MSAPLTNLEKSERGETEFCKWMDSAGIAYLAVDSREERMPACFRNLAKRPDFLLFDKGSVRSAVDVKHREPIRGTTFKLDVKDHALTSGFESISGIPVWYVFLLRTPRGVNNWYWRRSAGLKLRADRKSVDVVATELHLVVEPADLATCIIRLETSVTCRTPRSRSPIVAASRSASGPA